MNYQTARLIAAGEVIDRKTSPAERARIEARDRATGAEREAIIDETAAQIMATQARIHAALRRA